MTIGASRSALVFVALALGSLAPPSFAAGTPQADCHRVSPRLECRMVHYRADLDSWVLGRTGIRHWSKDLHVRVGVQMPEGGRSVGDVLFLHGFSDRLDNHGPLFEAWNAAGFRVISFDLPGHGENAGQSNDINEWTFGDLAKLARFVELRTRLAHSSASSARPLILSGWSTGGLLATRLVQARSISRLERPVAGLILLAPGIALRAPWQIGDKDPGYRFGLIGRVTVESLTHDPNPPHNGPIFPETPVTQLRFGAHLMSNSVLALTQPFPRKVPTLVFVGGADEDLYVDSPGLVRWIGLQQARGARVQGVACLFGRHELDNEDGNMGRAVRELSAGFARSVLAGDFKEALTIDYQSCRF